VECSLSPVSLSQLTNGCTISDKLFGNFTATVGRTDVSGDLSLSSIAGLGPLREGFSLGLPLTLPATISADVPLLVGYSVTVLNPAYAITDIHLGITGSTTGTVTETVMSGLDLLATLHVGSNPLGGSFGNTADAFFSGVDSIAVLKEITNADVFSNGGQVTQEVSQSRVPEPASLSLLALGIAGAAMARRRKRVTPPDH